MFWFCLLSGSSLEGMRSVVVVQLHADLLCWLHQPENFSGQYRKILMLEEKKEKTFSSWSKHDNYQGCAKAETNFLVIMKASEIPLGSLFGTQLTAVITVSGCICLHLTALFPPVTFPSICLSEQQWKLTKIPSIGAVWSFNVLWWNSLPWEKSSVSIFTKCLLL